MTTYSVQLHVRRDRALSRTWFADLRIAGSLMFSAGAILLMGIIIAEALYPAAYSTGGNEISDLGGTRPPAGIVYEPVATIFNLTLMLAGMLTTLSAISLQLRVGRWLASVPIAILGLAAFFVGVFPGPTGTPHAVIAMIAFISGGFAAVLGGWVARPPFRYVLVVLGLVNLTLLASYFTLGDASPFWVFGVGGAERLLVYPVLFFLMGFGGYLAGTGAAEADRPTAAIEATTPERVARP
jgi:hypothetical membrane protein